VVDGILVLGKVALEEGPVVAVRAAKVLLLQMHISARDRETDALKGQSYLKDGEDKGVKK
jgi:hypothetical protein